MAVNAAVAMARPGFVNARHEINQRIRRGGPKGARGLEAHWQDAGGIRALLADWPMQSEPVEFYGVCGTSALATMYAFTKIVVKSDEHMLPEVESMSSLSKVEAKARALMAKVDIEMAKVAGRSDPDRSACPNEIPWNPRLPGFYSATSALADAEKVGNDHEILELQTMDFNKLRRLLRSPKCGVRFASTKKPPYRTRVCRVEWRQYLGEQADTKNQFDEAVEEKARELLG
jgi:hypothetical protein